MWREPVAAGETLVLWDVIAEHFQEAAFSVRQFTHSLDSCEITLSDLARYPENGLFAQIDALVLGGDVVRKTTLEPVFEAAQVDDPEALTAAALVLVESGKFTELEPWLGHESAGLRRAAAEAGRLTTHASLDDWLRARSVERMCDSLRIGFLRLSAARGLLLQNVLDALQDGDPELVEAAAQTASFGDANRYLPIMEHLLDHPGSHIREVALQAAMNWNSARAWSHCRRWALDPAQPMPFATALYAALGTRSDHRELAALLATSRARRTVLFALGFSGNAELWPFVEPWLESPDPVECRTAAQSLGLIFGFDPSGDAFSLSSAAAPHAPGVPADKLPPAEEDPEAIASLPPFEEDDLDAELAPTPEELLPAPNVEAIRAWCRERSKSARSQRILYGEPYDVPHTIAVLGRAPMRVRHILASALRIRSGGAMRFDTRAITAVQRTQLSKLPDRHVQRYLKF